MPQSSGVSLLNVEYFFRIIYNTIFNSHISISYILPFLIIIWQVIAVVAILVSVVAIAILVYSIMQLFSVRQREIQMYKPFPVIESETNNKNIRWDNIQKLILSENVNDWRQAIIESDILLGETLSSRGYIGTTIGDQLKSVGVTGFNSINDAWEAHKVRNEIAHTGSSFELSNTLVLRTIARYQNVFNEFNII